jgi:predicted anti-sigma-YlaC factor YlaD
VGCQAIREQLIDHLYDELAPEAWVRIERHLLECGRCEEERAALQELSATLLQWEVPMPPVDLVERTLARLQAAIAMAPLAASREWTSSATPFLALALGGIAALASLGSTAHLSLQQQPSLMLATLGIFWAVLYGSMFLAALSGWLRLKDGARVALLAGGLAILWTPVLSIPDVVEACSTWLGMAKGSIALNALLFVLGGLYTAAPLLVAHLVIGHRSGPALADQSLASGLMYLLLVAPVFYLQCAALALGVGATWMGGAILGVLTGGPAGLWLAGQRRVVLGAG